MPGALRCLPLRAFTFRDGPAGAAPFHVHEAVVTEHRMTISAVFKVTPAEQAPPAGRRPPGPPGSPPWLGPADGRQHGHSYSVICCLSAVAIWRGYGQAVFLQVKPDSRDILTRTAVSICLGHRPRRNQHTGTLTGRKPPRGGRRSARRSLDTCRRGRSWASAPGSGSTWSTSSTSWCERPPGPHRTRRSRLTGRKRRRSTSRRVRGG